MLGALYRTTQRLWLILCFLGMYFYNIPIVDAFWSAVWAYFIAACGIGAAYLTFWIDGLKKPVFKYVGCEIAGGWAEIRDDELFKDSGGKGLVPMPTPYPLDIDPNVDVNQIIPADLFQQWGYFIRLEPYSEFFQSVVEYMASNPATPAATVKGGHRGASLLEHSFNTWRTMRKEILDFEYRGMVDGSGKIWFPQILPENGPYL